MIDLERGWPAERLGLEPLAVAHAAELAQGRGYASEAARSLVTAPRQDGWTVTAHVHPRHLASQRVARAAGLVPAAAIDDGETRWVSLPPAAP